LTPDYGVNRTTWHKLLRLFVGVTKIVLESTKLVNQVSVALQPLSDDADAPSSADLFPSLRKIVRPCRIRFGEAFVPFIDQRAANCQPIKSYRRYAPRIP